MMKTMKKILLGFLVIAILFLATLGFYSVYINLTVGDPSPYGVLKIVNYTDGRLLVGRRFTYSFNEQLLMRLNSDGTVDNTFKIGEGFGGHKDDYDKFISIEEILIQNDGRIIVGGKFGEYNGEVVNDIIRLNSDGTRDKTFNTEGTGFDGSIRTLAQQGDKILVGGQFFNYNGEDVGQLTRLNNNGGLDRTFKRKDVSGVEEILVLPDSQILVAGSLMSVGNATDGNLRYANLVRLNSDGTFDSSFIDHGFNAYCHIRTILRLPDGKIMVGGNFQTYAGVQVNGMVRLMKDGSIDRSFNKQGSGFDVRDDNENHVTTIESLPNGKIIVGGVFTRYNGEQVGNIVVLDSEGSIDSTAKISHFDYEVRDIHFANENIWIGGDFFKYGFKNVVGLTKIPLKSFE